MQIKDIQAPATQIQIQAQVTELRQQQTKHGKPYLSFKAVDKTGSIECRIWDLADIKDHEQIKDGVVIELKGEAELYRGSTQMKVTEARVSAADPSLFQPSSIYRPDEMMAALLGFIDGIENEWIRSVARSVMLDEGRSSLFEESPAATGMHHAFRHGLLEHTLQMLETAEQLFHLTFYAQSLNKDIVIFGLMFHDFGKIFEYSTQAGFSKTVSGIKNPHIPKTAQLIYHYGKILSVPDELIDELCHVVLAHHRFLAWGSPVKPATPEALFVHYIDNLHGDVFGAIQHMESDTTSAAYVRYGYGDQSYTLVKERTSDLIRRLEEQHGKNERQSGPTEAERNDREENRLDGF